MVTYGPPLEMGKKRQFLFRILTFIVNLDLEGGIRVRNPFTLLVGNSFLVEMAPHDRE